MDLQGQLIRLAYRRPDLRRSLLPLLKEAVVGLPPHTLTQLVQKQNPAATVSSKVVKAGMRWTAAVARSLGVWQQQHSEVNISNLMKDAPVNALLLLQGNQRAFHAWASAILPSDGRQLGIYLEKALHQDYRMLMQTIKTAARHL